jgi:hypothetical protein
MASRGGPAAGDTLMGSAAAAMGPGTSLVLGGALTVAYVGLFLGRDNPVRRYVGAGPETGPGRETEADTEPGSAPGTPPRDSVASAPS